jgi:hypothetical protein
MKHCWFILSLLAWLLVTGAGALAARDVEVLVVSGAPGEAQYEKLFAEQRDAWKSACERAGAAFTALGGGDRDAVLLEEALKKAAAKPEGQLWLVLVGHGTFDGREAKFNLRGPDVTAKQLALWCAPVRREMVVVHGGSASAAFLTALAGRSRILVSATQSADEIYFTRFGGHFAEAIAGDLRADLDQDRQVSVLEAFRHASRQAAEFYEKEERIATEHALLDDNGDGVGTRAEVFTTRPKEAKDGARAAQVALVLSEEERRLTDAQRLKRDELERRLEALKGRRGEMAEDAFYREMEVLLRELAQVYGDS